MKQKGNFMLTVPYLAAIVSFFLIVTANQSFILFPVALKKAGNSDAFIGFAMGVAIFSGFLGRPFMGQWVDRYGRRPFLLLGSFLAAACILLYMLPVTQNHTLLIFVRLAHGFSYALYFTAIWTWVADYSPKDRLAEGIGIFGAAGLAANASGSYGGEWILRVSGGDYHAFYMAASAVTLLGLLISLLLHDVPLQTKSDSSNRKGFLGILKRIPVSHAAFVSLLFGISMGVINNFTAVYLISGGRFSAASFFPYYALAAVLTRFVTGKLADRVGRLPVVIPGVLMQALGQLALASPVLSLCPMAIGFFMGTAHGLIYPAMNALLLERAGVADRGSASALFNASIDLGNFGGSLLFGCVASCYGYSRMYSSSGVLILLGLAAFIWMERKKIFPALRRRR